jgi:hypothetical protein
MREFVSAGGELIIHGALHQKNSPTPHLFEKVSIVNKNGWSENLRLQNDV